MVIYIKLENSPAMLAEYKIMLLALKKKKKRMIKFNFFDNNKKSDIELTNSIQF